MASPACPVPACACNDWVVNGLSALGLNMDRPRYTHPRSRLDLAIGHVAPHGPRSTSALPLPATIEVSHPLIILPVYEEMFENLIVSAKFELKNENLEL